MSRENLEQAKRAADAYNRRDVEAVLQDLDPEVEWHSAISILLGGQATVYRGHDGVRELFREFEDVLDEIHVEFSEIRDPGDRDGAPGARVAPNEGLADDSRYSLTGDGFQG